MNRLNPLYIIAFIVTVFFVTLLQMQTKNEEFLSTKSQYELYNTQIKNFIYYKKNWFNKQNTLNKIDQILKHSKFKKERIKKEEKATTISLVLESSNKQTLNNFLSKILNEKFIIKKIKVEQKRLFVEIGI